MLKTEKTLKKPQGNLRSLASQPFTIQEAECSRISRGLHDGLGQDVVALTFEGHAMLMEPLPQEICMILNARKENHPVGGL